MTTAEIEQLARSIVDRVESHIREPFIPGVDDPVREMVIHQIAEEIRLVWNARGAADLTVLDEIAHTNDRAISTAIQALNR